MKLNPYVKTMCQNTVPHQAENSRLWVGRAAAALETKSDEKGVPVKRPVVEKDGKKAVGLTKQKKPLVGGKKAAASKTNPAEKKPATEEKKPEHTLKFVYSIKVQSL